MKYNIHNKLFYKESVKNRKRIAFCRTTDFMCYNYALHNIELVSSIFAVKFVLKNYKNVILKDIKNGDLVMFWDSNFIYHFANILKVKNKIDNIIVKGKFGSGDIYKHTLANTPLEYGSEVNFWRLK
jgi:hypothetical protein